MPQSGLITHLLSLNEKTKHVGASSGHSPTPWFTDPLQDVVHKSPQRSWGVSVGVGVGDPVGVGVDVGIPVGVGVGVKVGVGVGVEVGTLVGVGLGVDVGVGVKVGGVVGVAVGTGGVVGVIVWQEESLQTPQYPITGV